METSILLQALHEDIREHIGFVPTVITSDLSPKQAAAASLVGSLFKKWAPKGISKAARSAALDDFVESNRNCGLRTPCQVGDDILLGQFSHCLQELLGWRFSDESLSLFDIVADGLAPGPGASLKHNNTAGFLEKYFQGPISATSEQVLRLYRAMIFRSPSWAAAELQRFHEFGVEIVAFNKLFFAPKNAEIARACCTEPGINMLLQQGQRFFIESRLKEWGINLSTQEKLNKDLARMYSIDDNGVTIDLRSSSNSISLDLVQAYIPTPLRGWLLLTRSPSTLLPNGEVLELKMVSSMGNGYTFPLQTAIFTCIVKACHILKDIPFDVSRSKRWGVFGDDIICSKELSTSVLRLLYLLGFNVNEGKTFTSGPFRESCGGDYFNGVNIRGVYLRRLDRDPLVYSALNRLNRWTVRTGIPLKRLCKALLSLLRHKLTLVPRAEGDDAGLHVPSDLTYLADANKPSYKIYRSIARKRSIDPQGPEAAGYGFAISVALLGGYISSPELSINDKTLPGVIKVLSEDSPDRPIDPLVEGLRAFAVVNYRRVSVSTLWWDWHGLRDDDVSHRDVSWGAVVWVNCFSAVN